VSQEESQKSMTYLSPSCSILLNLDNQAGRSCLTTWDTCSGVPALLTVAGAAEDAAVPDKLRTVGGFRPAGLLFWGILHAEFTR
jgi:hypothetical protein